ncbi:MAG: polyphosphate polymerase domain-containing protein [Salinivirgaceae bacterium]|jgi:hypothetical protein|nr:polyphosphate polymerase domain-containing protein [Salinivirgaceae bacterium]
MASNSIYKELVNKFHPIQLDEINQLKLLKRIDKKYVMPVNKIEELLERVKNDYRIMEINGDRDFGYHTNYYDTPELSFYINHQNQRANRFKVRTRDYIVSNSSFLEVKRKTNKRQTIKTRMPINACESLNKEHYDYLNSVVDLNGSELVKSSENSFRRITLVSFETLERITLDYDLKFYRNGKVIEMPFISIVEVKRDKAGKKSPIVNTLKSLNVHARGFSKYCMGLALLIPKLKQNSFKKNKLYLKKLEYATTAN